MFVVFVLKSIQMPNMFSFSNTQNKILKISNSKFFRQKSAKNEKFQRIPNKCPTSLKFAKIEGGKKSKKRLHHQRLKAIF